MIVFLTDIPVIIESIKPGMPQPPDRAYRVDSGEKSDALGLNILQRYAAGGTVFML